MVIFPPRIMASQPTPPPYVPIDVPTIQLSNIAGTEQNGGILTCKLYVRKAH